MKTKFNPANWLESTRLAQWVLSQHSELDAENFLMWLGSVSYLSPDKCQAVLEHLDLINVIGDDPVLHLPIKGVWFDKIASGEKREEYRDIWGESEKGRNIPIFTGIPAKQAISLYEQLDNDPVFHKRLGESLKKFDVLHLTAGYGHDKPQLWAQILSITIGMGNPDWGAEPGVDYFVIRIGEILNTKNFVLQSEPFSGTNV